MSEWTVLLLAGQVVCAGIGVRLLGGGVAARLPASSTAGSVIGDVWVPLALVMPLLLMTTRVGWTVGGVGWLPLGAPTVVGVLAVAVAMLARGPWTTVGGIGRLTTGAAGAGLILLMLAGAHDLTIWVGQCTFAVAAVMLWMNTPGRPSGPVERPGEGTAGGHGGAAAGMTLVLSAGQGVCALFTPAPWTAVSGAIALTYALVGLHGIARRVGPAWSVRIGVWAAALGTLLGIGSLSVLHLTPQSISLARGDRVDVTTDVAHSFGTYAPEAMLLILLPVAAPLLTRLDPSTRRGVGVLLAVVAAGLSVWRLLAV